MKSSPRPWIGACILACMSAPTMAASPDIATVARKYDLELVTSAPRFPIRLQTGTIDGEAAEAADVESYLAIFAREWSLYPPELVRRTKLKKIVFCTNLTYERQRRTGIPDFQNDVLYLDVARGRRNELYVRKVIHHEFFHIIDLRDDGRLYEDERWSRLNPPPFKYGAGGRALQDDPTATAGTDEPGFLNRYAAAGVEEDKAEVFAHMMVEPRMIAERCQRDSRLRAKVERMRELLAEFCPDANSAFWANVERSEK